ncbi:MAG: P1 family peptidase [Pseudomonadota bacterium]
MVIDGLKIGTYTDDENRTGCTVLLPPAGSLAGASVRGGAPGTRELGALSPNAAITACHGIALCGSSLFGLRVADGVVDWCAERKRGLPLAGRYFPIVGAAVVFDLHRPEQRTLTSRAGYLACENASSEPPPMGPVGVGTGCSVGKEAGLDWAQAAGQGWATRTYRDVTVMALMAVNAFGSIVGSDGRQLAGCQAPASVARYPRTGDAGDGGWSSRVEAENAGANTVIGCIVTNARISKAEACRVADLAHNGIARAVRPAHTSFDGDTLFAVATGEVSGSLDLVSEMGAEAVEHAIRAAVMSSPDDA